MRDDMAKVIVERPRLGGGVGTPKGELRRNQRVGLIDLHKHEGMKRRWRSDRKGLNENLAPLRRFLRSRCGRPWDKVYGEICERINRNSAVQLHIWQHLVQFVSTNVIEIDGDVYDSRGRELFDEFFVHPRSRLLCVNRKHWREGRRWRYVQPCPSPEECRFVDDGTCYRRIDGVWYELTMASLPRHGLPVYDYGMRKFSHFNSAEAARFYGRSGVYAASKRQLNSKEIRRLLQNR